MSTFAGLKSKWIASLHGTGTLVPQAGLEFILLLPLLLEVWDLRHVLPWLISKKTLTSKASMLKISDMLLWELGTVSG